MKDQTACGKFSQMLNRIKPILALISLQFGYSGMYIITMVSFKHGMSHYILSVYRHVVALLIIAPFAIVLERKIRPKMTLPVFLRLLALAFLEPVLDQNLYNIGMKATSTTYASAFINLLPAITFVLALIFRLETVDIRKIQSVAKVIGTAITVSGAMVMTLYKGPMLDIIKGRGQINHRATSEEASAQHWVTGTLMLIASCGSWASFFILQSFTLKLYPAELSLTAWICLLGIVEGSIVSLIMERDMSVWVIGWDSRLLACVYTGVVCSGMAYYVQGMVIRQRGPVFVTTFSPLCMIITAVLGTVVLAEKLYLGRVIGAIVIVIGLYTVVWGKSKDGPSSTDASSDEKDGLPIRDNTSSIATYESNEINVDGGMSKGSIKRSSPLATRTT